MLNRIFITLALVGTFATAGVLFKNSEVEKVVEKELAKVEGLQYRELYCVGVTETLCFISEIEYSEGNKSVLTADKIIVESVGAVFESRNEINATIPVKIGMSDVRIVDTASIPNSELLSTNDLNESFNITAVGEARVTGNDFNLNFSEFSVDTSMVGLNLSFDLDIHNATQEYGMRHIGVLSTKRAIFDYLYEELQKDSDENLSKDMFLSLLAEETTSEIKENIKVSEEFKGVLKEWIKNEKLKLLNIQIDSKSGQYINLYELFTTYSLVAMFGNFELLDQYIDNKFNIKMEVE